MLDVLGPGIMVLVRYEGKTLPDAVSFPVSGAKTEYSM
jgi:hypothetical protein